MWAITPPVVFDHKEGLLYDAERDLLVIAKFLVFRSVELLHNIESVQSHHWTRGHYVQCVLTLSVIVVNTNCNCNSNWTSVP